MTANLTDLARALQGLGRSSPMMAVMSDDERLPSLDPVAAILPPCSLLIARSRSTERLAAMVESALPICRRRLLTLLIANEVNLAIQLGADGVHLSEARLRASPRRPDPGRRNWIVTASAHDEVALQRAARCGIDLALLSPVFPTASHPDAATLGPLRFVGLTRQSPIPVLALGGMNTKTALRLRGSGAVGIAGIGFGLSG